MVGLRGGIVSNHPAVQVFRCEVRLSPNEVEYMYNPRTFCEHLGRHMGNLLFHELHARGMDATRARMEGYPNLEDIV